MSALNGIRVADFTRVVSGPYCTMLLGDLGAEVIKIEEPTHGDDTRSWKPPALEGESTYFLALNRNKKSICLDLQSEEGRSYARRLILECDIVVENFRPGLMERFGLGYETLRDLHPRLIYCAISGYGQTGPYRDRAGYDVTVQALGGLMAITGTPDGPPVKTGVALIDMTTGLYAFSSILAALYHREQSGQGQRLDVSLLSAQLAALINVGSAYLLAGKEPNRMGSAHESIVPYQVFQAEDGYIMIGAANDKLFGRLCEALGHPEWATDPRFIRNSDRVVNREIILKLIEEIIRSASVADWEERLAAYGVSVAPVNTMAQVFADPQVVHSKQVVSVTHPTAGDIRLVGPAVTYSETPAVVTLPPPLHGEHTEEIVRQIEQK